jgi:glycerate 2-kinase
MNCQTEFAMHDDLLNFFSHSLAVVNGRRCVENFLLQHALPMAKMRVIAIGKAAASMLQGVLTGHAHQVAAGLIITKAGHTEVLKAGTIPIVQLESAHPYPDQRSIEAGRQLLQFIEQTPADCGLLFLISGGTSSLVEVLPAGVTVEQLQQLNRWLLAQGWPIDIMNRIRKSVSLIKAGRLARYVAAHPVMQLVISDVPGDDLSVIGSGLLVPDSHATDLPADMPDWLVHMQAHVPPAPTQAEPCFANIQSDIIASNTLLRAEMARQAEAMGYALRCNEVLCGDAASQGVTIAQTLLDGPAGLYLWGGETVVTLPAQAGEGGRCQHLALAAAQVLAGHDNIAVLGVGTDGNDGPGDVAGALIDGQTLQRARDAGALPAEVALRQADAGRFLAASGDLVDTGPTGTNVMDIVIGLKT